MNAIGDLSKLPARTRAALLDGIESTKDNTRMDLVLALNYSGRWDILNATKIIAQKVERGELKIEDVTEATYKTALSTARFPDPDLMIRTSGETRLSNFLLWELSYAEFQFIPTLWPDFTKSHFYKCILNYQNKERRFGMISEQLA